MSEFGFRSCTSSAWEIVRDHWFSLVSAAFLRELLSIFLAGLAFAAFIDWRGWNLVIALIVRCVVWCALQCGYLKMCLNVCDNDKVNWKTLFSALNGGTQMLLATTCVWCAVTFGLALFVVPGLYLAVRFSLYGFTIIDQKLDALRSLVQSHRMLKGFAWYAAAFLFIYCTASCLFNSFCYAFELLLNISLCTLYKHIRAKEATP